MSASKAIIFDLDDTLYAERDYVSSGFQAVAEWISGNSETSSKCVSVQLESLYEAGHHGDTFQKWVATHASGDEVTTPKVAELIEVYRNHVPTITAHPATGPLLTKLKAAQFRLGLVSDGHLSVQRRKFSALGLEPHFHAVVFSDEFGRENWKPSVKPFETVLQRLKVASQDAIYIADNPLKDFIGPRKLGMKSIRVRFSGGVYAQQEPEGDFGEPDLEVIRIDDVAAAIESLFSV